MVYLKEMKNRIIKDDLNLLYLSHFLIDAYAGFLMPVLPLLREKFDISIFLISIIMSISYLGSSIMQPLFGDIADKMKSYLLVTIGLIFTCATIGFIGLVKSLLLLSIIIILTNLGEGLYHPQATSLISTLSDNKNLNKNLGKYLGFGILGFGSGPVICGYVVNSYGIDKLVYCSIIAVIPIIAIYFFLRKIPKNTENPLKENFFITLANIFKNNILRRLILLGFMRPLILINFCVYMPFLWKEHGLNTFIIGLLLGLFSFVGAFGSYLGGLLTKRFDRINIFLCSLILTTICGVISIILQSTGNYVGVIFYLLTGFCINLHSSINLSIAYETATENQGTMTGIINGFNWGVIGLSLSLIGFFVDIFSVAKVLLILSIIPSIFCLNIIGLKKRIA